MEKEKSEVLTKIGIVECEKSNLEKKFTSLKQ
jgi:hypothetical protein